MSALPRGGAHCCTHGMQGAYATFHLHPPTLKNSPFKIVLLLVVVLGALLPLHWVPAAEWGGYTFKRVDFLSDLTPADSAATTAALLATLPDVPPARQAVRDSCPPGMVCIDDYEDDTERGMTPFYRALTERAALGRPVRVAYLGDSFIEVDILTSDLRRELQRRYGGCGVGFLDAAPPYAANRGTVHQRYGGWESLSVLDKGRYVRAELGLSQRYGTARSAAWIEVKGTREHGLDTCEVQTIYLSPRGSAPVGVKLNNGPVLALPVQGGAGFQALRYEGRAGSVKWQVPQGYVCWGVAVEGREGVSVDNFSLRGSSGITLAEVPVEQLTRFGELRPYDLIVVQFGLNVASKKQLRYDAYARQMKHVVERLKTAFPQAGILIVGVGDREDKLDDGQLHTMPGVLALMKYQQNVAAESHVAYWNLFQAMGGEGSIRRMAAMTPPEAGKDYTHINARGGKRIAHLLYKTLVHGHEQYKRRQATP